MKLNLTDDEKGVELPENEYGIPILIGCTAVSFIINFLLSGNPYYAMGSAVGAIILPGLITLISLFFTRKWSLVFGISWLIIFGGSMLGQFTRQ